MYSPLSCLILAAIFINIDVDWVFLRAQTQKSRHSNPSGLRHPAGSRLEKII